MAGLDIEAPTIVERRAVRLGMSATLLDPHGKVASYRRELVCRQRIVEQEKTIAPVVGNGSVIENPVHEVSVRTDSGALVTTLNGCA